MPLLRLISKNVEVTFQITQRAYCSDLNLLCTIIYPRQNVCDTISHTVYELLLLLLWLFLRRRKTRIFRCCFINGSFYTHCSLMRMEGTFLYFNRLFFKERKSDGKIAMKSLKIPTIFIFCGCSLVIHLHTNYHRWYKYCRHKQSVTKLMTHKKLITKLSKRKVF